MYSQEAVVNNQVGLHARPATFFIQKANEFKSSIWIEKDDRRVNAKSLLGVLSLGIVKGTAVNIVADVIMAMSGLFARLLAGAGLVIASGVIDSRREEVLQTIREQRFELLAERQENGWCAFAFRMA